jgi:predicted metal-dependent peptidase
MSKEHIYSMQTIESIIANPNDNWKTLFKESVISMIASNKNELLWYANFLSRCEYEFHFNESFTSAVYFNGKNFVITINPVILGLIEKDQIIAILKHSAGHIINHHFSRNSQNDIADKEIIETAKDIVINGSQEIPYIQDLPATGDYKNSPINAFFYQTLTQKYGIQEYEVGREFEYYVSLILASQEEVKEIEQDQSCSNELDDSENETDAHQDDSQQDSDENDEFDEINFQSDDANDVDENSQSSQNSDEEDLDEETDSESSSSEEPDEESESSQGNTEDESKDEKDSKSKSLAQRTLEALENGECNIDSHEFGEELQESVGLDDTLLESFMNTTLQEMIHDATDFARGFTPGEATGALARIQKRKSHKDWRKIFNKKMRNFLTNSVRYREPNKSRQHPIYPDDLDLYGYTPGKKPKIGVVLDVSGSVNDTFLSALMSEIQAIQKKYSIKNLTLVQVDAEIQSIEKFGVRDKFIVRNGGGGTIMEPGFSVLLKQSKREIPDIIICATDGDIEERFEHITIPNNIQVIWLIKKDARLLFDTSTYPKQQMNIIEFSL